MNFKFLLKLLAIGFFASSCNQNITYDIVILNGQVYNGTVNSAIFADIGIKDSVIIKIGDLSKATTNRVIDAKGLVVAPGFIDVHAHLEPILELSNCESHVRQGVTTSLGGPDGSSPWPFG